MGGLHLCRSLSLLPLTDKYVEGFEMNEGHCAERLNRHSRDIRLTVCFPK